MLTRALSFAAICLLLQQSPALSNDIGKTKKSAAKQSNCKKNSKSAGKDACETNEKSTVTKQYFPPTAQIELEEEGGFAYRHNVYTLSASGMNGEQQKEIAAAIKASGLMDVETLKNTNPAACDVISYAFTLTVDGKKHVATFDDSTLTEPYRKLAVLVRERGAKRQVK